MLLPLFFLSLFSYFVLLSSSLYFILLVLLKVPLTFTQCSSACSGAPGGSSCHQSINVSTESVLMYLACANSQQYKQMLTAVTLYPWFVGWWIYCLVDYRATYRIVLRCDAAVCEWPETL